MQYNEDPYNGSSYDLTEYTSTLTESIGSSDAVTKSMSIVKTDSQGSADAISGNAALQAFLETVTIYQRANTPFAYNNGRHNDFMYNARADEDEILLMAIKAFSDSVLLEEMFQPFVISKALLETIVNSGAVSFSQIRAFLDFVFLSEFFTIQVTNKALNDSIRTADWLSIERQPGNEEWFD